MSITHVQTDLSTIQGGVSSVTKSVTVVSGTNLVAIVAVHMRDGGQGRTVSSVTSNGVALTQAVQRNGVLEDTTNARSELWYLVNPPTGTYNIVVTYSGSTFEACFSHTILSGVDQVAPIGVTGGTIGNGATPSLGVATQYINSWLIDCTHGSSSASSTVGANQTERENRIGGDGLDGFACSTEPTTTTGTYTMSWNAQESEEFVIVVTEIKEATAVVVTPQASLIRTWK